MSRTARGLTLSSSVATCLAVLLLAGPIASTARADQVVRGDARHDVVRFDENHPDGVPARTVHDPDVIRTRIAHKPHQLVIRLTFAELERHRLRFQLAQIATSGGGQRLFIAFVVPSQDLDIVTLKGPDGRVRCPRLAQTINYRKDYLRVTIPRTCLGVPRWVKVGVGVSRWAHGHQYADDALQSGGEHRLQRTRRLYVG